MNEDPYKVCPECGGEYQYTIATCVDCGMPLVFPEEISRRDARELPLSPGLVRLRTAPILWVRALAADLERAGIPHAVDRRRAREEGVLSLYVRRRDREAAAALDALYGPAEAPESAPKVEARRDVDEPAFKVCPECGGEYRPEIERCADCGILLVEPAEDDLSNDEEGDADDRRDDGEDLPAELAAFSFPEPPRHELPASDDLVCLYCAHFSFLGELSAALDGAGIAHRIERGPYERLKERACLYLRPMDCDTAERLMKEAGDEAPGEERACPACGAALPHRAANCPACGLGLYEPEVACPHCGAIVASWSAGCPNCGLAIGEGDSRPDQ
jgi:predicted amidophosphoribosyltransferase